MLLGSLTDGKRGLDYNFVSMVTQNFTDFINKVAPASHTYSQA